MYYLPYRASIKAEVRNYSDSWGIKAYNGELAYTHPFGESGVVLGNEVPLLRPNVGGFLQ